MKKLLLSFVMMLIAAVGAWAQYVEQDGLRFSLHDSNPKYAEVEAPASGSYSGEISIPSSVSYGGEDYPVTYIGGYAFKESAVTKVTIPSSVTHILGSAFQGCASLTELNLSEGLEDISSYAFEHSAVTSLTIPGTVTRIQSYAMEGMTSLTKLTFAYGTEELSLDWSVFNGTNNVTELVIDRYYTFGNGNGISYSTVKKVTFGEHLTTIPYSVCQGMSLNELNVGANVTAVDSYAFFQCTLPEGCNFPFTQIKEIKEGAFYLTKNLPANLDLTGVETLAENAFANCELQSVILPMTVTSIGRGAFSYVENVKVYAPWLTSPASLANPDSPDSHQQQFYFDKATLYVPAGTMDTYKSLVGWKEFETIDYWSFNVSATVAGKGSLKMSNGETVHANGTNTEKTVIGTQLVEAGAGTPVSGLFVREKDVTFTATPARGYELSSLTANTADIKAAGKVANLLADQNIAAQFTPIIYNITYNNLQNGVVNPANPTTYTVEDAAITLVNPTRTAYIFKGWTGTDLTEPTMNVTIPASSIGNREFTATWEPIVYDITYDLAGGAVNPANLDKYTIETADFTLTNPTKLGYTFLGWEGTDLTEKTMAVTVTTGHWGDRSYTATWEPNPYKVRFDINGGDGTETMADQDHVYDAPLNLTQNAFTRTGYTFKEWNSKADGTGTVYADKAEVLNLTAVRDEVVTLYAQWTPNPYQVRFNTNNGTGSMDNEDFVYDTAKNLTENVFTRRGYTFEGWNTKADGSGDSYADKASVKNLTAELNGIVDLYAQWQVITYTISYDLAGGSVATANPTEFTVETETFTLVNPTRTGYIFDGWTGYDLSEANKTVTIAKGSIDNRSYVANWTPITYQIAFHANNGSGTMANQVFTYDVAQALTQNIFTRTGYTYEGWNTKADGSGTPYTDKQELLNLTAENGTVIDVYAQWQIIPYTVTYDHAGGSVATANPTEYNVETATFTLTNPTREGYDFAGWEGTGITGTTTTVTIAKGSIGDRTYTATWTPIVYDITYDLAGGSVATANPTSYTIETATFSLNNPTKAHWIFKGWTGTGLSAAAQTVTIAKGSIGTRAYTATWEREVYTVSITSNLANAVTASTTSPEYEDDVVLTIADDEDYDLVSLTVDGVDVTSQISGGKFTINNVSANVAVVATYNANKAFITMAHAQQTFSCTQPLDFTGVTGLKAYIASGYIDGTVVLTRVDKVPASTGLFLVGTEGAEYKVPFAASSAFYSNLLKPVLTAQTVPSEADGCTNFLYSEVNGVKGFYKSSGSGTVAAGKAYLQLPTSALSNGVKAVGFIFEGDETGIDATEFSGRQLPTAVYDMAGRKVADTFDAKKLPQGVYIVNGKKIAIK